MNTIPILDFSKKMAENFSSVAVGSLDIYERARFQTRTFDPTEPSATDDFFTFISTNVHLTIDRLEGKSWLWVHTPIIVYIFQTFLIS